MLRRYTSQQLIYAALITQVFTALVFLTGSINGLLGLAETTGLLFVFLCCLGFVSPNASALSLLPFAKNAGSASALMGAIQMGIGALASVGVSIFNVKSAVQQ
jgi:DHA1 family bicyclomycin/chloramphenicol resistance-like MFS transporter